MARRPLPRILSSGSAQIARSRELARTAADSATDVLHPLITITRGLRRLAAGRAAQVGRHPQGTAWARCSSWRPSASWSSALVPYGPLLAVITPDGGGRLAGPGAHARRRTGPDESETQRLQALYEALVPYFSAAEDPSPLYAHGGEWDKAFRDLRVRRRRAG